MPIYEYQCKACGHNLEAFQKVSDDPLKKCPECGQDELEKLVSAASFHLKGSGWYVTDFRDSGKKDQPKTKDSPSEPASKETKPAKKSETKKEDKS